jgi:hypothetical protein
LPQKTHSNQGFSGNIVPNRYHLRQAPLANGKEMHARACQPILVGFVVFSTKSKKRHTPIQSPGTRLGVFFAVRKQSPPQVTPVEGLRPKGKYA